MAALRSLSAISRVLSRRCGVVGSPLERTLQIAKVPPAWRYFSEWSTNEDDPQNQENQQSADSGTQSQENPYFGISTSTFPENITKILMSPLDPSDIEMKPDGLIYLPEIKYRRILNRAFGPGGWALMPRGEIKHFQNTTEGAQLVTREYALYCLGRFVSQSIGEHTSYTKFNLSYGKALESAKSNALMRCCKDLGIASELWDPQFIGEWKSNYASEVWCENIRTKEKKKLWRKKGSLELFPYPWKEIKTSRNLS